MSRAGKEINTQLRWGVGFRHASAAYSSSSVLKQYNLGAPILRPSVERHTAGVGYFCLCPNNCNTPEHNAAPRRSTSTSRYRLRRPYQKNAIRDFRIQNKPLPRPQEHFNLSLARAAVEAQSPSAPDGYLVHSLQVYTRLYY